MSKDKDINLDDILTEIGEFGKFQKLISAILFIPICLAPIFTLSYIFTASQLEYRFFFYIKLNFAI